MEINEERNQLIVQSNKEFSPTMMDFEQKMMSVYQAVGLPIDDILVPVNERKKVFKNFMDVIEYIPQYQLESAHFITKFMTAASVGLFDSALNHLWVETIKQLKTRIKQYDIDYFYDVAVPSERRDEFSSLEDLDKVDEVQLLEGARKIELLTEKGYRQLDHIRYMLGYMQRESGNQSEVSGTELISWLEICIKEVITLEIPSDSIQAQILLRRIKEGILTQDNINDALAFISGMSVKYANVFAKGIFGLYLRQDTSPHIIMNIKAIMPSLWERIDGATKNEFATAYAIYSVNDDKEKAKLARAFISIVGGEEYLPDNVRGYEIKIAINQLLSMHRGMNNFYNEPQFAKQLERLVGTRKIPTKIDRDYALGIVDVFLTNGNGVCWDGDVIYKRLINRFTERQAFIAVTSFQEERISNKLSRSISKGKFLEMLQIIRANASNPTLIDFIDDLLSYKGNYGNLSKETKIKRKIDNLRYLYK
jgi:hypothetical protein